MYLVVSRVSTTAMSGQPAMKSCATQRAIGHSLAAAGSNPARQTSPFNAHIESKRDAQVTPVSFTTGKPSAIHSEKAI